MHTFYLNPLTAGEACLEPDESAHCLRVLRMRRGDEVRLIDGCGHWALGSISRTDRECVWVEVAQVQTMEPGLAQGVWIAVAPTKNIDRVEWFVEKAVEVGVGRITPFVAKYGERRQLRVDRLERIALAAAKQSLTPFLPRLDALTPWEELVKELADFHGERWVAHLEGGESYLGALPMPSPAVGTCVLIGPEGGFAPEEIAQLRALGVQTVHLGVSRLRVETAALVACVLCAARGYGQGAELR